MPCLYFKRMSLTDKTEKFYMTFEPVFYSMNDYNLSASQYIRGYMDYISNACCGSCSRWLFDNISEKQFQDQYDQGKRTFYFENDFEKEIWTDLMYTQEDTGDIADKFEILRLEQQRKDSDLKFINTFIDDLKSNFGYFYRNYNGPFASEPELTLWDHLIEVYRDDYCDIKGKSLLEIVEVLLNNEKFPSFLSEVLDVAHR